MSYYKRYAGDASSDTGPSGALWCDCPVEAMEADPSIGYIYWNDFVGPTDPTDDDGWAITATTTGSIVTADMAGGGIVFDSAGHNAADDGIEAQMPGESWVPAAGKTLWFEVRVKMTDVDTTPDQFFVGLSTTDTTLMAAGVLDAASNSLIGFYTDSATASAGTMAFITDKASSTETDADAVAEIADATFVKLGFKVYTTSAGALALDYYVDGVKIGTVTDTDDIPIVEMCLSFVSKCEQTSADAELTADWVRIAQLR